MRATVVRTPHAGHGAGQAVFLVGGRDLVHAALDPRPARPGLADAAGEVADDVVGVVAVPGGGRVLLAERVEQPFVHASDRAQVGACPLRGQVPADPPQAVGSTVFGERAAGRLAGDGPAGQGAFERGVQGVQERAQPVDEPGHVRGEVVVVSLAVVIGCGGS